MGTRCLTYVFDEKYKPIVCIYRQFDGYPEGHGEDLKRILEGIPITNGIPSRVLLGKSDERLFSGMEELAAVLVQKLKEKDPHGNIYLVPPVWPPEDHWQEYEWCIFGKVGRTPTVYYRAACDSGWVHWFGPPINILECLRRR